MKKILSDDLKPGFPKKTDEKSGFEYDAMIMSDDEIDSVIEEFSSSKDVDNALQNMALTIKHLADMIENYHEFLGKL